jgi:putative ABC transport system permease protein
MTALLAVLALPVVGLILFDALRHPTVRRLAVRNVAARKGEALLVVIGSMLGTAIITASFIVGDTLGASIRDAARTELGPADEVVRATSPERQGALQAALAQPVPGTDGVLHMVTAGAAFATPGQSTRAEPSATLLEVDFEEATRFGGDVSATGLGKAGRTPSHDEAVLSEDLADELRVRPGDRVRAFAYGKARELRVRQVLAQVGVAGFGHPGAFVAPGTISSLAAAGPVDGAAPPNHLALVSNRGGVFDGVQLTDEVTRELEQRTGGLDGIEIQKVKQDVLEAADDNAKEFTELFGGIGAFSVIAGILLLVNIFVMLAEERKSELGILRAVGMRRNQLVRTFGMEGGIYAVIAALAGAMVGIGVGRVVVLVAHGLFQASEEERFRVSLRFTAERSSLVSGFVIGGAIALITVWGTSLRMGRLNVIRAIRELPEPPRADHRRRGLVLGILGMGLGGLLSVAGITSRSWFGAMAGPPLMAWSAVPVLARMAPRRVVVSLSCAFVLFWGVFCFILLPDTFEGADIPTFVVQGIILVSAAVALGATNSDVMGGLLKRAIRPGARRARGLSARLAVAYPMARRFRTSMLLGMYALVMFVLTFLAVFNELFSAQAPRFTNETRAGYDIVVDSNPANPVTVERLEEQPEVVAAAPLLRGEPEFTTAAHPEADRWPLTGFDQRLLERGLPALGDRQPRFPDDQSAWRAVLDDPGLAIVSDFFLQEGGGPPEARLHPGDRITVVNPATGERRDLTVAGLSESDWLFNGVMAGARLVSELMGPDAVANRHYVAVRPGVDPEEAAVSLTGRLLANGVDADAIGALIDHQLEQQEGFLRLMQGYLALGLLIGIAGLGVVMVRSVRERRRQIGMLRAMGFPSRVVRGAFLMEAGFVAVQGIVTGVVLALVVSYQLLTNSDTFGEQGLDFVVPWAALAVLVAGALGASVAATAVPAQQASRIRPAAALRVVD